jgi:thioredoxin-related protein
MKQLLYLVFLSPLFITGQEVKNGIKFERDLTWDQIKSKANSTNTYIFIDVNASWCVPCKMMDKLVFINEGVGKAVNASFISVKVQVDTSVKDNVVTKSWYAEAKSLKETYKVKAYPTFLFFAPSGRIIHRASGARDTTSFINLLKEALDPEKQYYQMVDNYHAGKKDTTFLQRIIKAAQIADDEELAFHAANDIINQADNNHILDKENIRLIKLYTRSTKDRGFQVFYNNSEKVNRIVNDNDYVQGLLSSILYREYAHPIVYDAYKKGLKEANWKLIFSSITKKYKSAYAERVVNDAQINFYDYTDQRAKYATSLIAKAKKYEASIDKYFINNIAWDVFKYSSNKKELTQALSLMEKRDPLTDGAGIDTYANLLYKLGRVNEAIIWQKKAIVIDPNNKEFVDNLNKMERRIPTWLQ